MQIVSIGDNLHEMSNPVLGKNNKNTSMCRLLKILPCALTINKQDVDRMNISNTRGELHKESAFM